MMNQYTAATKQANPASEARTRSADRSHLLALDPREMSLTALVQHCATQSEHFYRGRAHDTRFAYELFRRALVERDELAWEHVYTHYCPLVEGWVRRSG